MVDILLSYTLPRRVLRVLLGLVAGTFRVFVGFQELENRLELS